MGQCCSIPEKYVISKEVFPSNQFDQAEEWIRSQRNGRENTGYMFHGPIRLRFDGGWYVAVICIGEEKADGSCDCDIEPEVYDCTETDDPGFCYYLAGIPGLGVFEEGGNCDCGSGSVGDDQANTSGGCDKCGNTFAPCELGCPDVCSCCWREPPPEGPDGVVCTEYFKLLEHNEIKEYYPEILQNKFCQAPALALLRDPDSVLGRLVKHLKDFRYIDPTDILIPTFRGPEEECRVEMWARCSCEGCGTGPGVKVYAKESAGQAVDEFPGIGFECVCKQATCVPDCLNAEDLQVEVLDEWQALQIGGIWKSAIDEPSGCPCACSTPCPSLPEPPQTDLVGVDEATGIETVYKKVIEYGEAPPEACYEWIKSPEEFEEDCIELTWVKEELSYIVYDGNFGNEGITLCVKYTLLGCDRVNQVVFDITSDAVSGLPCEVTIPFCDENIESVPQTRTVDDGLEYSGTTHTLLDENTGEFSCVNGQSCSFPAGIGLYEPEPMGKWVEDTFPIEFGGRTSTKGANPLP